MGKAQRSSQLGLIGKCPAATLWGSHCPRLCLSACLQGFLPGFLPRGYVL
jgi:hypothetical protein